MEERKKILSKVFTDCWKLCKEYCLNGDDNWALLIGSINALSREYKENGEPIWMFYRAVADALVHMKEAFREEERKS